MPSIRGLSFLPARSYLVRLPLFTRAIILIIALVWTLSIPKLWDLQAWGALIPDKVSLFSGSPSPSSPPTAEAVMLTII